MALCMGRWTTSYLVTTAELMDTLFLKIYRIKSVLKLALGWDKLPGNTVVGVQLVTFTVWNPISVFERVFLKWKST